jgi:eukaryotic-like serine/threonine-protein kinase
MAMDGSLSLKLDPKGDTTFVALAGDITEESDFSAILNATTPKVVMDLGEIRRINSTGVREWIKFVTSLARSGKQFKLVRCAVAIVHQLNMISNFRGGGEVKSVLAPYYCADCDANHLHLIDVSSPSVAIQQTLPCPTCKGKMEFDELPDSYLSFKQL